MTWIEVGLPTLEVHRAADRSSVSDGSFIRAGALVGRTGAFCARFKR
jgi:hypothetical protein